MRPVELRPSYGRGDRVVALALVGLESPRSIEAVAGGCAVPRDGGVVQRVAVFYSLGD
jgi:hypothetical protein